MSTSAMPALCDDFNSTSATLQTPSQTQTPSVCDSSSSSIVSIQLPSMDQFVFNSNSSSTKLDAYAKTTSPLARHMHSDLNGSIDSNDTLVSLDLSADEHKHDHDIDSDDSEQTPRKVADGDQVEDAQTTAAEQPAEQATADNDNSSGDGDDEEAQETDDGDTSADDDNSNASKSASTSHARSVHTSECEATQSSTDTDKDKDTESDTDHLILGRFGYEKVEDITRTLQGTIFIAKTGANTARERQVVIKKTSKSLHSQHVTVQNGKKFGIYENILKECIILKYLTEHRNGLIMTSFTKYDNFFDDGRFYFLSMEHGGSDLFDYIIEAHELLNAKKLKIKEWRKFTKYLFWQMIVVLRWLHNDMRTCHLDLSLENILIKNGNFIPLDDAKTQYTINSNVQIKLCDFGLAEIFNAEEQTNANASANAFDCTKYCGKTNYKAPEVYSKNGVFDARKADVWSLGVVLFCMLVGSPPYNKPVDSDQAYLYVKNGIIDQLLFQWERNHFITVKVLSLLHNMLCFEPDKRFLVDDVIQHSWLSLYYHKYKHQMSKKSQLQQSKRKRNNKARLPYYKMPQNTVLNISQ